MNDPIRQAHYMQKLANLVNVNIHAIEAALGRRKPQAGRTVKGTAGQLKTTDTGIEFRSSLSSPVEEYCLALLLQHPEFKEQCQDLAPEYFSGSENRQIFLAYREGKDVKSIREHIDPAIREHFDSLLSKSLPADKTEERYASCALRLRESFLRNWETKKEAQLIAEAESKGSAAALAKLAEQGIETSIRLKEVFDQRSRGKNRDKGG